MAPKTPLRTVDHGSFEALRETWLRTLSTGTQLAYRSDLGSFGQWAGLGSRPLAASTADISAFQRACLDRGESASTIRRRSSALSSFFQFALTHEAIDTNPVIGSDRPGVLVGDPSATLSLDADYVERYLHGAARFDDRLHAIASLLACDGLKLGEALALDTDDITGRAPNVVVRVHRAGAAQRVVLSRRSSRAVHRCAGGRRHEPLFISKPHSATAGAKRRLTRFGADHLLKQIPGPVDGVVTSNALRRYYIHTAATAGTPIDTIGQRAGIGDRRSTRRYLTMPDDVAASDETVSQQPSVDHGSDRRSTNKEV